MMPPTPKADGRRTRARRASKQSNAGSAQHEKLASATAAGAVGFGNPLKQVRLSDQVYERVFRQIASGQLATGTRLPTEAELCKAFDVSRPVVRDALARLRADGLINSRQGSGSYVERRPDRDFLRFAPSGNIADLLRCFEFRIGFEGDAAAFAAQRRTTDHLSAIKRALDDLAEENSRGGLGQKADLAFHMAIAEASGNYFFVRTMELVERYIEFGMRLARSISITKGPQRLDLVQREHTVICEAVHKRDPHAARAAMQLHIASARARILTEDQGGPKAPDLTEDGAPNLRFRRQGGQRQASPPRNRVRQEA